MGNRVRSIIGNMVRILIGESGSDYNEVKG